MGVTSRRSRRSRSRSSWRGEESSSTNSRSRSSRRGEESSSRSSRSRSSRRGEESSRSRRGGSTKKFLPVKTSIYKHSGHIQR
jgi:arginine/serine-rich splicing factor 4/5/6/transcription factor SPN1